MKNTKVLILGILLIPYFAYAQSTLTPELLWQFGRVGSPVVSPDGSKIIYGVTYYNLADNKGNRDLYIMPATGGDPVKITDFAGSEFNEVWRPDGKKIAFLATKDGAPQLWEMNPDGSEKKKLTSMDGGLGNFAYAPDMANVYFTHDVKLDKTVNEMYPDLPKAEARIIDDLMYRHWNEWSDYKYSHIFVNRYQEGELDGLPEDIMSMQPYDSPLSPFGGAEEIAWSRDGKMIAYTCKKMGGKDYAESTNSDIYLYDLASGETTNITEGMNGYDKEPVFSPDGKMLSWTSMERAGFESDRNRIFVYDFSTKEKRELTKGFDRDANHHSWNKDGSKIYFLSGEKATYQLFEMDFKSGEVRQITKGQHNYTSFQLAGDKLIAGKMSMSMPTELYEVDIKTGKEKQVTFTNQALLEKIKMGKVEERWITTTDGKKMLTWVIYPPYFNEMARTRYPTLLYCQGGPQSAVSQFFSYRWNFQLMAAQGYIVVAPNRRGLPSFGREWNDQISKDWGGQNMKDYLTAIDSISVEAFVDQDKLGAIGASYGGYSVYWLAGNHQKRFKAFLAHCGLFNLESWYGTTEEMFFANWDIGGPYWEPSLEKGYLRDSPHRYVKNWDTPIMVIHSEKDFRVPIGEGIQAFQAAQLQNIPSRFLYFPEEGHWVLSPQNGVLWHREFFRWLDEWLK